MIKVKIVMDEEKIKNESNLSVEETYDKIEKIVKKTPRAYIQEGFICSKPTRLGINDIGTVLAILEILSKESWFLPYAKHLLYVGEQSTEDVLPLFKILPKLKDESDLIKYQKEINQILES